MLFCGNKSSALKRRQHPQHGTSHIPSETLRKPRTVFALWRGLDSPLSLILPASFTISLSVVRCWLNQVRDWRCGNRSVADENDNASTMFGYWDARILCLHQANISLCNPGRKGGGARERETFKCLLQVCENNWKEKRSKSCKDGMWKNVL